MGTIIRKLKRSIVMLLVCAMVAGSVPVNTYAAELDTDAIAASDVAVEETMSEEAVAEETTVEEVTTDVPVTETEPVEGDDQATEEIPEDDETTPSEEIDLGDAEGDGEATTVELTFEGDTNLVTITVDGETVAGSNDSYTAKATVDAESKVTFSVKETAGNKVTGVTAETAGETPSEVTLTPGTDDETVYSFKYDETVAAAASVTVTITAEAETSGEPDGDETTKYPITINATGATVALTEGSEKADGEGVGDVTNGEDLVFTVSVTDEDYVLTKVAYKIGEDDETLFDDLTVESYTISKDAITAAVTIIAVAEEKAANYTPKAVTVAKNEDVTVKFADGCTADGTDGTVTVQGQDLTFTVVLNDKVKDSHEITGVGYKLDGNEEATPATEVAETENTYTIAQTVFADAEAIEIIVETKEIEYEVTFNITNAEVAKVTGEDEEAKVYADKDVVTFKKGETLSFTVDVESNYIIKKVTKTVGTVGEAEAADIEKDGDAYTVTVDADMTITVLAEAKKTTQITWNGDYVTISGNRICSVSDNEVTFEGPAVWVEEGDTVNFTVTPDKGFLVRSVKIGETDVLPNEDGKYTVVATDVPQQINVEASEIKTTKITWIGENVTIKGKRVSVSDNNIPLGSPLDVIEGDYAEFTVTPADGFRVMSVEVSEEGSAEVEKLTANAEGKYIVYATQKNQTVSVVAEQFAVAEDKTVQFVSSADKTTFKVTTGNGVTQVKDKNNTYTVAAGTESIKFTVTVPAHYSATVVADGITLGENANISVKGEEQKVEFEIPAAKLADGVQVIRIFDEIDSRNITLTYDGTQVGVSAVSNGQKFTFGEDVTTVDYGTEIKVTVTAKENYRLTSLTTSVKESEAEEDLKKAESYTFTIKATEDYTYTIDSEGIKYAVLESNGVPTDTIVVDGVYTAKVYQENGDEDIPVDVTAAGLYVGKTDKKATVEIKDGTAQIIMSSEVYTSKNATNMVLKLTTEIPAAAEGADPTDEITELPVKIVPALKTVTVKGVDDGVLTQSADTTKEYAITLNPVSAVDAVKIEVVDSVEKNVISECDVKNGKLMITTSAVNSGEATVILYNKEFAPATEDAAATSDLGEGGVITVKIADPAWVTKVKPTVKLQGATNTTITLNLGAKGIEPVSTGALWYKVVAETETENIEGVNGFNPTVTQYVPYEEAVTTTVDLFAGATLNDGENTAVTDGSIPVALDYKVTVSVVHTENGAEPNYSADESNNILYETAEDKVGTLNKASTKLPYYETNLKLNKGTTTVFTGQKNIVVATPKFSKQTTYTDIVDDVVVTYSDGHPVEDNSVSAWHEDGKILVSVDNYASAGKYTVTATAAYKEGTKPSTASVVVNVVYGINNIEFNNIPVTLYKADKKAASFKVAYTANHKFDDDGWVKPNKNKVNLSIVVLDNYGQEIKDSSLLEYVTIKSGKVNVRKDYVIDPDNSTFRIKAVAADYEGNIYPKNEEPALNNEFGAVYSDEITITNQTMELGEVVIVDRNGTLLARSKDEVNIDDLATSGVRVEVLRKGVEDKKEYNPEDFIDRNLFAFTSSNKSLYLEDGYIQGLAKEVKKAKITATLTDGSGKKAELKDLTIKGSMADLMVMAYEGLSFQMKDIMLSPEADGKYHGTFNGIQKTALGIVVASDEYDGQMDGLAFNYKINFTNAKKVASEDNYFIIEPTKKDVIITLENKNTGATKTYVLTNESVEDSLPSLGNVKVDGNFVQNSVIPDKVNLVLPKDFTGKYVKLSMDNTKLAKMDEKYINFISCLEGLDTVLPVEGKAVEITLDSCPMYDGSYKLFATVGDVNDDGIFIAETKDSAVTFKVNKASNAKLKTSYTLNLRDGDSVTLTSTDKKNPYIFVDGIRNVNIKGTPNNFTEFFDFEYDYSDGLYKLFLKEDLTSEQLDHLTSNDGKNDLTAWVDYMTQADIFGSIQIKVTVKNASAGKYAITNATIPVGTETANVAVTKDKSATVVKYAYSADNKVTVNNGAITIDTKDFAAGKNKVTVYVVDDNVNSIVAEKLSRLATQISTVEADAKDALVKEQNALIEKYGAKLTTTVNVLTKDKAKTQDKISLAAKKVTLTADNYKSDKYSVEVNVNRLFGEVESVTLTDNTYSFDSCSYDNDILTVSVSKEALDEAVKAEGATVNYGDKIKLEFTFKFKGETDTYESEKETLEVTLPQAPKSYEEVAKDLDAIGIKNISFDGWDWEQEQTEAYYKNFVEYIADIAIPKDVKYTVSEVKLTKPEPGKAGSVEIFIYFGDEVVEGEYPYTYPIVRELKALVASTSDLISVLREYLGNYTTVKSTDSLVDILDTVKEAINIKDYPNLRLSVKETDERVEATKNTTGLMFCEFILRDIYDSFGKPIEEKHTFIINKVYEPRLVTLNLPKDAENAYAATVSWVDESVTISGNGDVYTKEAEDVKFTVTVPAADKVVETVTYKLGAEDQVSDPLEATEGVYTIPNADITDALTINVTLTNYVGNKITLSTEDVTPDFGESVTITEVEEQKTYTTKKDTDVTFTLTVDGENKLINTVTYKIGENAEQTLTADENGVYTIPAKDITGDITITVTLKDVEKEYEPFDVTLEVAQGVTLSFTGGVTEEGEEPQKTYKTQKDTAITFTLTENLDEQDIEIVAYKIGDALDADEPTAGEGGVYTIPAEKITGNVTIIVTLKDVEPVDESYAITLVEAEGAKIVFEENCVKEEEVDSSKTYKTIKDTAIAFTVEVTEGKEIETVTYKIGVDGAEQPLEGESAENGEDGEAKVVYTINAEDIIDNVTITVTLKTADSGEEQA